MPAPREVQVGRNSLEVTIRNLVDDKYNREYKLDRKTRTKAIEILNDYFAKHEDEATNVSALKFARTQVIWNCWKTISIDEPRFMSSWIIYVSKVGVFDNGKFYFVRY